MRKFIFLFIAFAGMFLASSDAQTISCPPNVDFESGTYNNWAYYYGTCCSGTGSGTMNIPHLTTTPPAAAYIPCEFALTGLTAGGSVLATSTGIDPFGGFPVVGAGVYSLRIGSTRTDQWAEKAEYYVHVPAGSTNYSLIYRYAIVLEDPGHPPSEEPRFDVSATDSATGLVLPCVNFNYVSSSAIPGFLPHPPSTGATNSFAAIPALGCTNQVAVAINGWSHDVFYKSWATASINLAGYAGHTVIMAFAAGDCEPTGHFGYGYIDMSCGLFAISDTVNCGASTVQLIAPLGFATYEWYDSITFTHLYGVGDTINVPVPSTATTIAVVLTPYAGFGCTDTLYTTVYPPSTMTYINGGSATVCTGNTVTLSSGSTGGTWSSSNVSIATVTPGTGIATGVSGGTAIIYCLTAGCTTTSITLTVLSGSAITGTINTCTGNTSTLTATPSGGTWSSTNPGVATISSGGILTSVASGSTVIMYSLPGGCTSSQPVTINAPPTVITAPASVCTGSTVTLSCSPSGGTWSSSSIGIATITPVTGVLTGVSAGVVTVTYSFSSGCLSTTTVMVNPSPVAITGPSTVCTASSITLSDSPTGGTWSSSNTNISIVPGTGMVTGMTSGSATITYTLIGGCFKTDAVTVAAPPHAITGPAYVCAGSTMTLSDTPAGGTWNSSSPGTATITPSSGILTGVSAGTTIVTYSVSAGCIVTTTITVDQMPSAITGATIVCAGSTITLSDAITGGTWNSGNTGIATVTPGSGIVTGVALGTSTITYTLTGGCYHTTTVTVSAPPVAITGPAQVCNGYNITLSDTPTGGAWSSSNPSVASIAPSTGIVTSVSAGTTFITYSLGSSCSSTTTITVNPVSYTIAGSESVCAGSTITLSNATTGGTWSSGNPTVATVTTITGIVTGISGGVAIITYLAAGCNATTTSVLVNPAPTVITGTTNFCAGTTTTLSDAVSGGTWSSSNTLIASISGTGVVTGSAAGSSVITYSMPGGCTITATVTVSPSPDPITGATPLCAGSSEDLSDAVSGGTWSSGTHAVATITPAGIVTGVSGGNAVISYTTGIGCSVTATITVMPLPNAGTITGLSAVCVGSTISLTDAVAGGVWSVSNSLIATISGGLVTGILPGTDTISYSVTNSCGTATVTTVISIDLPPVAGTITGDTFLCTGSTITLSDASTGGVWSSSNIAVVSVSGGGLVRGISAGTATITYTVTNACSAATATATITVYPLPPAGIISGVAAVCIGATFTLSETVSGGAWSSGNTTVATITSGGTVHAIAAGTAIITYTTGPGAGGCYGFATYTITVRATPDFTVESDVSQINCYGEIDGSITLTVTGGGPLQYTWSDGGTTHSVTNLATGIYTVTVTDTTSQCKTTETFAISQPDSIGIIPTITGDLCHEGTGSVSLSVTGGIGHYTYQWSNSKTNSAITGLMAGTYSVTVTDSNGCTKNIAVEVDEDSCSDIIVYNVLTPNGDGINDTWVIKGIENYPTNTVQVYDKWGDLVFEATDYKNNWNGKWKKGEAPDGTYFYLVKLNTKNGNGTQNVWTGSLLLKR